MKRGGPKDRAPDERTTSPPAVVTSCGRAFGLRSSNGAMGRCRERKDWAACNLVDNNQRDDVYDNSPESERGANTSECRLRVAGKGTIDDESTNRRRKENLLRETVTGKLRETKITRGRRTRSIREAGGRLKYNGRHPLPFSRSESVFD